MNDENAAEAIEWHADDLPLLSPASACVRVDASVAFQPDAQPSRTHQNEGQVEVFYSDSQLI